MGQPDKIDPSHHSYTFDSITEIQQQHFLNKQGQSKTIYLDKIRDEAYKEGFKKGLEDGFKNGQQKFDANHIQELQNYLQELEKRLENFEQQKRDWITHFENELSLLSLYITERLLHKCFEEDRKWVQECTLEITREALGQIVQEEHVRIYVNPFDLVYLEEHKTTLHEIAPKLHHIELVADRSIPGGCFIETDHGIIDSRVDHMLRKIIEDILN